MGASHINIYIGHHAEDYKWSYKIHLNQYENETPHFGFLTLKSLIIAANKEDDSFETLFSQIAEDLLEPLSPLAREEAISTAQAQLIILNTPYQE